jgi:hypothetical protein
LTTYGKIGFADGDDLQGLALLPAFVVAVVLQLCLRLSKASSLALREKQGFSLQASLVRSECLWL